MKVTVSEQTARKLIGLTDGLAASDTDQDIQQLRDRLKKGLAAAEGGGFLGLPELTLLVDLVLCEINNPKHFNPRAQALLTLEDAVPKLKTLRDRAIDRARADEGIPG